MVDVEGLHDDVELATHSSRSNFLERSKQRLDKVKSFPEVGEVIRKVEEIKGLDFLAESTAHGLLDALRRKSDAASVVFGHSLLDALLFALCKLSSAS